MREREREGGSRGGKRGPPKGGVARRMGRYVCRERTTDLPPSWNRCRSSGRKELLRSSGAVVRWCTHHPAMCVSAPLHTPHSLSLTPSGAIYRPRAISRCCLRPTLRGCARMRAREQHAEESLSRERLPPSLEKWRLPAVLHLSRFTRGRGGAGERTRYRARTCLARVHTR